MHYYHYTTESRINEIIESGVINLAITSITHKKEKPCAWVSTNQFWENTATKNIIDEFGNRIKLTFDEQLQEFGCARIQVKPVGLYTWAKLRHLARMNPSYADAMESIGIEIGGDPKEWFGSIYPIKKENWLKIEVLRNNEWINYAIILHPE